jgi:hypothetical protein
LNSAIIIPALVLTLAASLLLLTRSLCRIVFGAKQLRVLDVSCTVLAVFSGSIIAIDLMQESKVLFARTGEMAADFCCMLVFATMMYCAFIAQSLHGAAPNLRRSPDAWILILVAFMMSGWSYHRVQVRSAENMFSSLVDVIPGAVEPDFASKAITDEGTIVPLYHLAVEKSTFADYASSTAEKFSEFGNGLIRRKEADMMANCHGWVFTAGRFLLKGNDVDRILCDNHYYVVSAPKPGDIVIYRNEAGGILHTALVQGLLTDGTVITESKWGVDQRFLHLPSMQPYSQIFDYYRTDRPNHLIQISESIDCDEDDQNG